MIKVLIGNIINSPMQTKVNTVNCVGVMGKGIAHEFKKLNPEMFEDYEQRCMDGEVKPGVPYLYTDLFGQKTINFPTKDHWKGLSKIEYIKDGIDIFIENYKEWGIESVAFPPLGCGNGGLDWTQVGPIMYQKLSGLDIDIELYAPYGTKSEYLKKEFLMRTIDYHIKARIPESTLLPGWIAILEILFRLEQMKYTNYVGRIVFQKICYVATLRGLQTGFEFSKGKYGPYSSKVNDMYRTLGNANLISEEQLGNLKWIKVGSAYKNDRKALFEKLSKQENDIVEIVNLFSRVKSTEQAEEVGTILYAIDELSQTQNKSMISELEFYNYIMDWKNWWNNEQKKKSIASSIRNLAILGWLKLDYSDTLPLSDSESN